MHAMHYEITLPADYDMAIIRHRVATKGTMTDDFPGLGLKAYGIRERGVDGSPVNQYAPFYLWASLDGMNRFLWGGSFDGIPRDFGRPVVQQWTGLAFERGPAHESTARAATKWTERIAPDTHAHVAIEAARERLSQQAREAGVHSTALAIDTRAWELVRFTLWASGAPGAQGAETTYQVLHLSSPHLDDLGVAPW
jgi:Domain of unknown function (DUF4865)